MAISPALVSRRSPDRADCQSSRCHPTRWVVPVLLAAAALCGIAATPALASTQATHAAHAVRQTHAVRQAHEYQGQKQKCSGNKSIPVYMMHRIASVANLTRALQFSLQENDLFSF